MRSQWPGYRLGDLWSRDDPTKLTHADLISFIRHLPRDSALGRALLGEAAQWSPELHRLTDIADLLAGANWQRGGSATKKPKPIKRPY